MNDVLQQCLFDAIEPPSRAWLGSVVDGSDLSHPVLHSDEASSKQFRKNSDRGGNQLCFEPYGKLEELHGSRITIS